MVIELENYQNEKKNIMLTCEICRSTGNREQLKVKHKIKIGQCELPGCTGLVTLCFLLLNSIKTRYNHKPKSLLAPFVRSIYWILYEHFVMWHGFV